MTIRTRGYGMPALLLSLVLSAFFCASLGAEEPREKEKKSVVQAVVGATVLPVSGPMVRRGTVPWKAGKILEDAAALAAMKPGAVLCNVARGSLVDEAALLESLEAGQLSAAILDVTREEPLPAASPLWDAPNLYLSPHSAVSPEAYVGSVLELFARNLCRYAAGERPANLVEPDA